MSEGLLPPLQLSTVRPVLGFYLWKASQLCGKKFTQMSVVLNRVPIGLRGNRTDLALRSCTSLSCAFDDFLAISNDIASGASGSDSELCGIFIWGYNRGKGTSYGLLKDKKWGRV